MTRGRRAVIELLCGAVIGAALVSLRRFGAPPLLRVDHALTSLREFRLAVLVWVMFTIYWEIAEEGGESAED